MITPVNLHCDPSKNMAPHWPMNLIYNRETFVFYKDSRSGAAMYRHELMANPPKKPKTKKELLEENRSLKKQVRELQGVLK